MRISTSLQISLLFLLTFQYAFPQQDKDLIDQYLNYFEQPREKFHISSNQDFYRPGEEIRFSVFVLNAETNTPSLISTNILCGLYDSEGNQINRKVFLLENGIARGRLIIDPDLKEGEYFLHVTSDWSQNFRDRNNALKRIEITHNRPIANDNPGRFTISFRGEGGSIVQNADNEIVFKIENEFNISAPVVNGEIYNSDGELVVGNIKSDVNGIGKFKLSIVEGKKYTAHFTLKNGTEISHEIKNIENEGLSLSLNNHNKEKVVVNVRLNDKNWATYRNTDLRFLIHREGRLLTHTIRLKEQNTEIQFLRTNLLSGLNILTVFDSELKPIAERMFFNNVEQFVPGITAKVVERNGDSVVVQLGLPKLFTPNVHLSVSVKDTPKNLSPSILTQLKIIDFLNPRTEIDNLNLVKMSEFELDNFLIFTGKSNFDWGLIEDPPIIKYTPQAGFTIDGKIKNRDLKNPLQILLYQNSIKDLRFATVNSDKSFEFKDLIINEGDSLRFSIIDKNGKNIKPNLNISITPKLDDIRLSFNKTTRQDFEIVNSLNKEELRYRNEKKLTPLDPVLINADIEKKYEGDLPSSGIFEAIKISDDDIKRHFSLSNLVRRLGFEVVTDPANNTFTVFAKILIRGAPLVIIDGFRVPSSDIYDYPLRNIDAVSFEHAGVSGSRGGTLYVNVGRFEDRTYLNDNLTTILADQGFSNNLIDDYDNRPQYLDKQINYFNGHASLSSENSLMIKLPNPKNNLLHITLEGFTDNGKLIAQDITIDTEQGY